MLKPMLKSCVLAACCVLALASIAHAQSSLGIGSNEVAPAPASSGFFGWIYSEQQRFFRELQSALRAIRDDGWAAGLGLLGLSFAYGIFHAAGPGHGKAVISSYMLANDVALKRGIALSFASSIAQAISALVIVGAFYVVLRGAAVSMTNATWALEMASYALIALFGALILWRKTFGAPSNFATKASATHVHGPDCNHPILLNFEPAGMAMAGASLSRSGAAQSSFVCETCGHSHAPDPSQLTAQNMSLSDAWAIILAVGIRPCSGAIVVLSFALLNGLYAAGIASVFVMALGTAITVSALAAIAVYSKGLATRLSGAHSSWVGRAIEIFGALLVMTLGLGLLYASLTA
jgi:nickel/cobalt transporter (NicO) family protein